MVRYNRKAVTEERLTTIPSAAEETMDSSREVALCFIATNVKNCTRMSQRPGRTRDETVRYLTSPVHSSSGQKVYFWSALI